MATNITTDVLIVGAGPTGLAMAVQLIRHGVNFEIVDSKEGTTPFSRAIGVQARTLEIYEQIGLAQPLIHAGIIIKGARLVEGGKARAIADLTMLGKGLSPYPFLLIVEQGKHELILYSFLTQAKKQVRWQTTMESFSDNGDSVVATIVDSNGNAQSVSAQYLIACDGAKSHVRSALGLTFSGSTLERMFYVADVEMEWEFSHDLLTACLGTDRSTAFFPMPGEKRYRVVGVFPEDLQKEEGTILYDEIEKQILEDTQLALDITHVNWFSTYKVHSRRVKQFSKGRCFLAGDSAHIHSPAGAQGMNTGIQDGYNLAWKLAMVLRGDAHARLLETYNQERIVIARRLLETTDRFFDLLVNPSPILSFIRRRIFPYVANFALGFDSVNQFVFPLISQIGINYRHSPLSMKNARDFKLMAGDRMPYFSADERSVYDYLREPAFHLLTFSNQQSHHQSFNNALRDTGGIVEHHALPLSPQAVEAFGSNKPFSVLLRPDNYVSYLSDEFSPAKLLEYLNNALGVRRREAEV